MRLMVRLKVILIIIYDDIGQSEMIAEPSVSSLQPNSLHANLYTFDQQTEIPIENSSVEPSASVSNQTPSRLTIDNDFDYGTPNQRPDEINFGEKRNTTNHIKPSNILDNEIER